MSLGRGARQVGVAYVEPHKVLRHVQRLPPLPGRRSSCQSQTYRGLFPVSSLRIDAGRGARVCNCRKGLDEGCCSSMKMLAVATYVQ